MKKIAFLVAFMICAGTLSAQKVMSPEQLISLNRVSAVGLTKDHQNLIYRVSKVDLKTDSKTSKTYMIPVKGGTPELISDYKDLIHNRLISPDGKSELISKEVKVEKVYGKDYYKDVPKSNMMIYNNLNYRHWDTWEDGKYSHVFIKTGNNETDIMPNEPYDCPQKPFGGSEDYLWSPDGKKVLYVSKKTYGVAYAVSTNTDIYEYNIETKETKNLTAYNRGYDVAPAFSSNGEMAWLQMKRDGYEADKNDITVRRHGKDINLTRNWDGTVNSFKWSEKGDKIFFVAPVLGTVQLFEIGISASAMPKQITNGQFDVSGIVGQVGNTMLVSRRDMNHAPEIYIVNLKNGKMQQLTHENDAIYDSLVLGKIEKRITKTTDGKDLLSWVIYPPNFDPNKKYPTLLYCQGGPQGALSQFYSYRWNFQLMAANGYIIIAPNRRGMPGYGVEWNEQISKDYGGQNMKDYLSAIDDLAKEPYVDNERIGAVGASYGGYSIYFLASIHNNRFKTFIAHDGIFNEKSMYGTTEEIFFVNWDLGGAYWEKDNKAAQKSYTLFNPIEHVEKWNTPILIIQGGKDYRVPIGQGLQAFQAAQLRGIKSRLLYFPEENHWVLDYQNSLVWHREFYRWLKETL
ncbi:MAG: S9 family peptidase [Flavobacteriia bacterium]|nr:MAG: S9 family peptidase [Flavobacteriia bacterium]